MKTSFKFGYGRKIYRDVMGLDIGTSSVKMVWVRKNNMFIELLGYAIKNLPKPGAAIFSDGTAPIAEIIRSCIKQTGCTAKKVFLCLSGPALYTRRIPVVSMPQEEMKEAVKWALKDQISLDLEKAVIDYQVLGEVKTEEATSQTHILVGVAEKEFIFDCIDAITQAGLVPLGITLSPFALAGIDIKDSAIAILDIGYSVAELTLLKDGVPQFSRTLPGSGSEFTKAMTGIFVSERGRIELSYEEAERLKTEAGIPVGESGMVRENISNTQLLSLLRPVLERLIGEMKRSFDYCEHQLKLPLAPKMYLTGGGSLLKNLDKTLAKDLNMEIDYLAFAAPIMKKEKSEAVFFDIALATTIEAARHIDLIPEEIKLERVRRIERASLRLVIFISVAILLISYLFMRLKVYNLEKQVKIGQANYYTMQEVAVLKSKIDKRTEILNQLTKSRYEGFKILKALSKAIPSPVELDVFMRKENGDINIKGTVASSKPEAVLAGFIKSMQETGVFKNISINSMQKDTSQAVLSRFVMSCEVAGE